MPSQTVIWTALPNGYSPSGQARLSAHISPRLVPDSPTGLLSDFPDFLLWPATPITAWEVEFGNGTVLPAVPVTTPSPTPQRWTDLFEPATLVRGRLPVSFSARKIRSYPLREVRDYVQGMYVAIAKQASEDFPDKALLESFTNGFLGQRLFEELNAIEIDLASNFVLPPGSTETRHFAQLDRFVDRPAERNPGPADAPTVPEFDIHDMLSLAQDHPYLLRRLRLVVDLEIVGAPPNIGPTTVVVRATWSPLLPPAFHRDVNALTRCVSSPGVFAQLPRAGSDVTAGYYTLDDTSTFDVCQVDETGAALKVMNLASTLEQADIKPSELTPTVFPVPPIRTGGLGVFRSGRAEDLRTNRFLRSDSFEATLLGGGVPIFDADDLVQGARVDVDELAGWKSLSTRSAELTFTFSSTVETPGTEEAVVNLAASGVHDGSDDDLYVGEMMVLWGGWTLGAPRPGKTVDNDDQTVVTDNTAHPNGFPLEVRTSAVPGTLRRLRYGTDYRFRARTVDIAGNSLPVTDANAVHATPARMFGRFEPVESPSVYLRTPAGPAETPERVVLRSNYNTLAAPPVAQRHLLPPKTAQLGAEWHGMFDTSGSPSVVDAAAYALITGREADTIADAPSYQAVPVPHVDLDDFTVPWLPDPACEGLLLRGLDGVPGGAAFAPLQGAWPDLDSYRLVIREPAPMEPPNTFVQPANRLIEIILPKAHVRTLRLSSTLAPGMAPRFGLFGWLVDFGLMDAALQGTIESGRHWMFTPYRELVIVHAVKQPLKEPVFASITAPRVPGDTFATLFGEADLSRKSSARLDLEAEWDEYLDGGPGAALPTRPDPGGPGWLDRPVRQAIGLTTPVPLEPLDPADDEDLFRLLEAPEPGPRHEFNDTKHRDIEYTARVFSRFDEYFAGKGSVDFGAANPATLDAAGVVRGSLKLSSEESTSDGPRTVSYSEGTDFTVDSAAGTVERLVPTVPDVVDGVWVPMPNDRVALSPKSTNVRSSARPDPPIVQYILPTFSFETSTSTTPLGEAVVEQTRSGGGLRVYLGRPWWSSGGGEMLGVLTTDVFGPQSSLNEPASFVATQWGVDPLFVREPTVDGFGPARFPLRVATGSNLSVAEESSVVLSVAGHEVGFDEVRDLWYCDLEVDIGSTWPFVRLALARYQPDALPGLELSRVVMADFIQLAPERTATVVRTGTQTVNVSVVGPGYEQSGVMRALPKVRVTLQRRSALIGGDLGWDTVGDPITLTTSVLSGRRFLFSGQVTTPLTLPSPDLRLVIEEVERIRVDDNPAVNPVSNPRRLEKLFGERPVYGDVISLG